MSETPELYDWNEQQTSDWHYYLKKGLDEQEAEILVRNGISRKAAGSAPSSVVPFVTSAEYHWLELINERLLEANGDPDLAWERWADEERAHG